MRRAFALTLAALAAILAAPAAARPVTDCPLRDAPFSVDSPLIDILLSPMAKAVLEQAAPGSTTSPMLAGTTPPTLAAILAPRGMTAFGSIKADKLPELDVRLRALPVTKEDRTARCARYDNDVPRFALKAGKPRLLLFEKVNGYRDGPSLDAAHAAFVSLAKRKGWAVVSTDKGGAFNPATLRQFDAVIWNNVSGDVLTLSQRRAFEDYIARGGGFIGIHGSAGDFVYFWDWYADTLIGARFLSHTLDPQFQDARIVATPDHPVARGLPPEWTMNDEWYSFRTNPRAGGAKVVATLDEQSYTPAGPGKLDLRMGDHPIAWTNCVGRGRMFYSAIGHRPKTYSDPRYLAMLENAVDWVAVSGRSDCTVGK